MKIRMNYSVAGAVVDMADDAARRLIADGWAVAVADETPQPAPVESAAMRTQPIQGRDNGRISTRDARAGSGRSHR